MKHGAAWVVSTTVAIAIAIACVPGLPSSEPLGRGPLAEPEPDPNSHRSRPEDAHQAADAQRDAELEAGTSDAGVDADDAEPNADADADASDATESDADAARDADGSSDGGIIDFAGEYLGEDVSIIDIDGLPKRTERDPNARTNVEQSADDRLEIILINSANGDPLCSIEAKVVGSEAVVTPGQTCFSEGEALQGSVSNGKARLEDNRLILDLDVALTLSFGPETRDGSLDYHFEGERR
jgi:hypothetical protein